MNTQPQSDGAYGAGRQTHPPTSGPATGFRIVSTSFSYHSPFDGELYFRQGEHLTVEEAGPRCYRVTSWSSFRVLVPIEKVRWNTESS